VAREWVTSGDLPANQGGDTIMFAHWPKPLDDDFKAHYRLNESDQRFVDAKYELVTRGRNLRREFNIAANKKVKFILKVKDRCRRKKRTSSAAAQRRKPRRGPELRAAKAHTSALTDLANSPAARRTRDVEAEKADCERNWLKRRRDREGAIKAAQSLLRAKVRRKFGRAQESPRRLAGEAAADKGRARLWRTP